MLVMSKFRTALRRYRKARAKYRRGMRLIFPSPAELRFIQIMGGDFVQLPIIKSLRNRFPLTLVYDLGPFLRSEFVRREVRCGRYFIDFGNDILRGIEIDGMAFHNDKPRELMRDDFLESCGWLLLHIKATKLWRDPDFVTRQTRIFLWEGRRKL